jgi:hypothetical protein
MGSDDVQRLVVLHTPSKTRPATRSGRRTSSRSPNPRAAAGVTAGRQRAEKKARRIPWKTWLLTAVEAVALFTAALIGIIAVLGRLADWFGGAGVWSHLVPFAGAVLFLCLATSLLLIAWLALRRWWIGWLASLPVCVAVMVASTAAWFATHPVFQHELASLRVLVGGTAEAERAAIAHQVYAAYRRADLGGVRHTLERARTYAPVVFEAAAAFGVDPEVLVGVGAVESSFIPRDSKDGGRGLFQITLPPTVAVEQVRMRLGVAQLDLKDHRHNTFVAAATLRRYLDEMRGDLFLGLLAYNIGPRNGGLAAIMQRYGARDFVTIQPYLKHLPRDYPIRVLSAALAYRVWQTHGKLPAYQDGENAAAIQSLGIPGFQPGPVPHVVSRGRR